MISARKWDRRYWGEWWQKSAEIIANFRGYQRSYIATAICFLTRPTINRMTGEVNIKSRISEITLKVKGHESLNNGNVKLQLCSNLVV